MDAEVANSALNVVTSVARNSAQAVDRERGNMHALADSRHAAVMAERHRVHRAEIAAMKADV